MQEEQSRDSETTHTTTIVGWMAIGDPANVDPPPLLNESPLAQNDTASVAAGEIVSIDVLSNDLDEGLVIDASVVTVAIVTANESIVGEAQVQSDGSVLYIAPSVPEETIDTFSYSVTDAGGESAQATVTITIVPANTAPVAVDDSADVEEGGSVTIAVLANDTDQDGEVGELTVTATDGALGLSLIHI